MAQPKRRFLKPFDWGIEVLDLDQLRRGRVPSGYVPQIVGDDILHRKVDMSSNNLNFVLSKADIRISDIPEGFIRTVLCGDGQMRMVILPFEEENIGWSIFGDKPIVHALKLRRELNKMKRQMAAFIEEGTTPTPSQFRELSQKMANITKAFDDTIRPRKSFVGVESQMGGGLDG